MSANPQTFHFHGYTIRPMTEQDRPYLIEQIAADSFHRHKSDADFFLKPLPGESSWAMEDAQGRIVFYFKNSPVVRVHIQFVEGVSKQRNMSAMMKGLAWIENIFRQSLFREMIFDADSYELESFAKNHLGFKEARNLLSHAIDPQVRTAMQPEPLGTVPTGRLEVEG